MGDLNETQMTPIYKAETGYRHVENRLSVAQGVRVGRDGLGSLGLAKTSQIERIAQQVLLNSAENCIQCPG